MKYDPDIVDIRLAFSPQSNASDLHGSGERISVFGISHGNASSSFKMQKGVFNNMRHTILSENGILGYFLSRIDAIQGLRGIMERLLSNVSGK